MTENEMREHNSKVIEELVYRKYLKRICDDFKDDVTNRLIESLMKNGCPAKAIFLTLADKNLFGGRDEKN